MTVTSIDFYGGDGKRARQAPWIATAECIVLIAGVAWLDLIGVNFDGLPINPYLAVIVLAAAQHGLYGGLLAALLAIVAARIGPWPMPEIGDNYFAFLLSVWAKPLAWLLAGLTVGLITSRRIRAQERSAEALTRAMAAQALIEQQNAILADRTRRLERSLAGLDNVEVDGGSTGKRRMVKFSLPARDRLQFQANRLE